MIYIRSMRRAVVLILTLGMTACAPTLIETEEPVRPARSVLILTGAGMVPYTKEDPRYETLWLTTAEKYAEAVKQAMTGGDTAAQLHIIKHRSDLPSSVLARLVAVDKKDAVLQVTVKHVRTASENTIYLEAEFLPLMYQRYSNGRRVTPQAGLSKRYPILSTTSKDMRDVSIPEMAQKFLQELRNRGFLK